MYINLFKINTLIFTLLLNIGILDNDQHTLNIEYDEYIVNIVYNVHVKEIDLISFLLTENLDWNIDETLDHHNSTK